MKSINKISNLEVLKNGLAWLIGLALIFIIWAILSATVYKENQYLPDLGKCFSAIGQILFFGFKTTPPGSTEIYIPISESWASIGIALGQTMLCFVGSFILCICLVILTRYFKIIYYFMLPFVTLSRTLPTAILMALIAVFLLPCIFLVPVTVAFFVVFPMMYESITNAVNNVGKKQIEMANIFKVSKWEQFKNVYIPISTPYIFSSFVASFGLVFKIALASQMVQTWVTKQPDYPSVGMYIAWAIKNNQYDIVIAWGMIAIILSLIFELVIVKISRICIPSKFNDLKRIRIFFSRNKKV